ncbi:mycofactocin-coupled SDR family oxidoreductase [Rhodococcus opacus]|uniref:mycofactocin-coupled SDR family oxidoreductase n=1 Tax=Rhodococcus opacus TaxID=37919 RepID=UPI0014699E82|nr:mycofactocin-coupled SDR family oxidoreductase [Rhodococcus opacus]MDV7088963.1 mycofactocin-coupled SDR family oxidoreductase [Rhodococcus opacus]WKN60249.1 mycofactocin-coupled SDR family oxidoreductase [Rhodococcus opacus]
MGMLDGRTILVTGAARGQGRAQAVAAAREGADVVVVDVCGPIEGVQYPMSSQADLEKTVTLVEEQGRRAVTAIADVRDQAALDEAVQAGIAAYGKIDGVVANAGLWNFGPRVWETTEEDWRLVNDTVLGGTFRTIKSVAPHMVERRAGSIVVIASIGALEACANITSYVSAKHGSIGLMKNSALELSPYNVRCNAVCPGTIDTKMVDNPMGRKLFQHLGPDPTREMMIDGGYGWTALAGRSWLPADAVANAAVWLLSDLSQHVTGVTLPVDGGHLILPSSNMAPQKTGAEADRYRPPANTPD